MKTYIPKQPKQIRERLEAKLDARLVERLEQYCRYLESDRDYVVAQALEIVFRKDSGFADWLAAQALMPTANARNSLLTPQRSRKEELAPSGAGIETVPSASQTR